MPPAKKATAKKATATRKKATVAEHSFMIPWKGRDYKVTPGDFSALDDEWLADRFGIGVLNVFAGDVQLRYIAGLLYLVKRRRNDELTYDEVAGSLTFADFANVVHDDGSGEDD